MGRDVAAVPDVALEQTSEAQELGKLLAELEVVACTASSSLRLRPLLLRRSWRGLASAF